MSIADELKDLTHRHGAINNIYLDRFAKSELSDEELRLFAVQFFAFVKHFPRILAALLANTPDDDAADELATILTSELGGGDPKRRHEYLYHRFLRSVGIDPRHASNAPWLVTTRGYIDGLAELYSHDDYFVALGASFGLEHMAIPMWEQLIPGLEGVKASRGHLEAMDMFYWTFHRELEESHEESMEAAVEGIDPAHHDALREGCVRALDLLEAFWLGLEAARRDPAAA